MKEKLLTSAAKSAVISFTLGFIFVAGMISKSVQETVDEALDKEDESNEK